MPGRGPLALFVGFAEVGRRSVHRRPESAAIACADTRVLTVEVPLTCSGPGGDVVGVEDVAVDVFGVHLGEPGRGEHPPRICSPHMAPSPMPPAARETVMQCMQEMVYRNGPSGWSRLSANVLDAEMSTHR